MHCKSRHNICVNVFFFHSTRQLPIKSVKKIGKYKFHSCHTECHSRAPSSACSKWNQLKILPLKINITIQKPFRYKFFWIFPYFRISCNCPSVNINYSFWFNFISF
ncbi:hypothetical protein MTR67_041796 [Solanum verrucosum]|uniref:Uncharacterized protein n=1 Tax=Solanum verrucosum TaxID=315347 RepID=A0AAF0UN03_SOLVR|nr:hypothetical protein MTR67_041796 [Solanum verrucosum]